MGFREARSINSAYETKNDEFLKEEAPPTKTVKKAAVAKPAKAKTEKKVVAKTAKKTATKKKTSSKKKTKSVKAAK